MRSDYLNIEDKKNIIKCKKMNILTINEFSKLFKISQRTVYRMIEKNNINFFFKIDGSWRCLEDDVKKWIEKEKNKKN